MDFETQAAADRLVRFFAGTALAIGALALFGYASAQPAVTRLVAQSPGMAVSAAIAVIALAVALMALTWRRERVAEVAVGATIVLVGVVFAGHVVHGDDVASAFIGRRLFGTPIADGGRMSTGAALALLLIAGGIALRRRARFTDFVAGVALLIAAAALLGYLYDASLLYSIPIFSTMSLPTAAALFLLALATLLVEAGRGWSAVLLSSRAIGGATRRQLSMLLVPVAAGWLLLQGAARHQLGPGVALGLLVIITVVPMALLVLRDGRHQMAIDAERRRHAEAQAALARDLENRLARKAEELEHESEERSRAEAASYRSQRIEAIGQLTGGIAHDFNNLLAAISGNLELLTRKLPDGHAARRYAASAAGAVGKGAKLAGQLLAFSRSQRLAIQPTELAPELLRARDLLQSALGPSIELLLEFPRERIWVRTDADQLELAILNLAVNARDAMPDGGELRIESGVRDAVIPPSTQSRSYVSIRVSDNGVGMAPDVLAKAVEPFFTTRERGKGSGLGLAQVYGFVRQCEGDLVIESAPGQGTSVEILLPRTDAPAPRATLVAASAEPGATPDAAPRCLLVVDDDDAVRAVLVELLEQIGYRVTEASGGAAALARLDEMTPDGAVIDFLMPGMNGAEVARRAQDRIPGLPIVFVSGYSDTVALDGIAGAVVVRKPFRADQLQQALDTALAEPAA